VGEEGRKGRIWVGSHWSLGKKSLLQKYRREGTRDGDGISLKEREVGMPRDRPSSGGSDRLEGSERGLRIDGRLMRRHWKA
jgi:hypothetical protein